MRALRDFNLPKIVTDDVPIIMGLIGDLFPALNVPRKRDMDFEECVKKSMLVSATCTLVYFGRTSHDSILVHQVLSSPFSPVFLFCTFPSFLSSSFPSHLSISLPATIPSFSSLFFPLHPLSFFLIDILTFCPPSYRTLVFRLRTTLS